MLFLSPLCRGCCFIYFKFTDLMFVLISLLLFSCHVFTASLVCLLLFTALAPIYILLDESIQAQSKYRRYSQYLHHPLKLFLATASGSAGRNQNNVAPIGSLVEWNKQYKSTFAPMVPVSVAHAIDTRVSHLWGSLFVPDTISICFLLFFFLCHSFFSSRSCLKVYTC